MKRLLSLFLLLQLSLFSCADFSLKRNQLFIGPQWLRVNRDKDGANQQGDLFGVYAGYDRLKRYGWYWGADASYAQGNLKGKNRNGNKLNSQFTDMWIEGRLGYTFQQKTCFQLSFTPFVGIGYLQEKNNFGSSSPLPLHFKTNYSYLVGGFLYWMQLWEGYELGLNFRAKMPYEPKCHVSNDPENDSVSQNIGERMQYRIDIPLTYRLPCYENFVITLDPFYEHRHYGGHVNFPFDFFQTKLKIWGIALELVYRI